MAILLPDARELSDEVLEALRLRAVRGCELGFTEADVAALLGVCRETVSRWWAAYARDGLTALPQDRTGRPTGTGRTLSDQQAQQIQARLNGHSPEDLGIPAPLWTRRAVQQLIQNELGIAMPVRTVGSYLHRWGYTATRVASSRTFNGVVYQESSDPSRRVTDQFSVTHFTYRFPSEMACFDRTTSGDIELRHR
ncbi:helix-turn-helix domain-containing protein [Frigoriglobus tundricola]|uniref:helix-turn-helix domain-containing protein n=1 Tax=Frigoriglobus tundricola TaxID=2774151 RepID=UPI00148EC2AF